MKRHLWLFMISLIVCGPLIAEQRGPATAEEKDKAVKLILGLENDPLHKDAREARTWLIVWLAEVPDITVKMCMALLGSEFEHKKKYASELATQQALSSAAFIITNPGSADDELAVSLAGVEGVLKTYKALLTQKPKARFPSLEALAQAQSAGSLQAVVAENMKGCK